MGLLLEVTIIAFDWRRRTEINVAGLNSSLLFLMLRNMVFNL